MKSLLLLHGALGSKAQFLHLREQLLSGYHVVDLDFTGHGGNFQEGNFSIASFAEETHAFLVKHFTQPIDVFGYSMGGYVALQLAHDHPGILDRIMTLGTKFDWTPESAAKEVKMLNPEVIELKVPKFAESLSKRHHPQDWKKVMHQTADMMVALGNGDAMKEIDFRKISNRVLICVGSEDNMVSVEESRQVAEWLPNGSFMEIKGFKHPIEAVDPGILANEIIKFFN